MYFVLDWPANEGLVGRIHCRVREGGLRSPEESGRSVRLDREKCVERSGDRG